MHARVPYSNHLRTYSLYAITLTLTTSFTACQALVKDHNREVNCYWYCLVPLLGTVNDLVTGTMLVHT